MVRLAEESAKVALDGHGETPPTNGADDASNAGQSSGVSADYEITAGTEADLDTEAFGPGGDRGVLERDATTEAFYERYGGVDLKALALEDLERAVDVDPAQDEVRRQRDGLRREIEEARVSLPSLCRERAPREASPPHEAAVPSGVPRRMLGISMPCEAFRTGEIRPETRPEDP